MYKYGDKNSIFRLSHGYKNTVVSIADDFKATNATPYDVLTKCLNNTITGPNPNTADTASGEVVLKDNHVFAWVGARMTNISGRFSQVVPFILFLTKEELVTLGRGRESRSAISVRVRSNADVKTVPKETRKSMSVWAQPYDNSDNYIRLGVVVGSDISTGASSVDTIAKLTPQQYTNSNIQKQSVLLLSYNDLLSDVQDTQWLTLVNTVQAQKWTVDVLGTKKKNGKAPNRNLYADENAYIADMQKYKEKHGDNDNNNAEHEDYNKMLANVKNYILYALRHKLETLPSEFLYEVVYGRKSNWFDFDIEKAQKVMEFETGAESLDFSAFDNKHAKIVEMVGYILRFSIRRKIRAKLQTAVTGLEFTLTDKQFFCTNNALSGWNLFKLDYDTSFGVGIHSLLCTLKYATFSPSGARYTLIECPFKDIHDIVYQI